MSAARLCPHCLKSLGAVALPVCPHCGQVVPPPGDAPAATAGGLPVRGDESFDELARLFLPRPLVYEPPANLYLLEVLVAGLLVLLGPVMLAVDRGQRQVAFGWTCFAAAVALAVIAVRNPGWRRVSVDRLGLRCRRGRHRWSDVERVVPISPPGKRQLEPAALEVHLRDGRRLRIRREWTARAAVGSLRHLAELLERLAATHEREGATHPEP